MTGILPELPSILQNAVYGKPLGDLLLDMQSQFPPFNFYYDKPEGMSTNTYLQMRKPVEFELYRQYGEVKRWFLGIIKDAEYNSRFGDLESAIYFLQYLIRERYPNYKPYDLLIGIYKKQNRVVDERDLLRYSIGFFKDLKEKQGAYIIKLANDLNIVNEVLDYNGMDKKIHYYGGAFVLYDPVKVLVKWEERMKALFNG